jgi:hypothetical protein
VISGIIAGYKSTKKWRLAANNFFTRISVQRGFIKIFIEFLTEVAVLVLVFPTLDTIIEQGKSKVTKSMVFGSVAIAFVCLFVAGIMAGIISKDGEG